MTTRKRSVTRAAPGSQEVGTPLANAAFKHEEAVGIVIHYYSNIGVAVVQVNNGFLNTGSTIHIVGHNTDLTQTVTSMEYEHQLVDQAGAGQCVGIKIADHAREHDIVYLVR